MSQSPPIKMYSLDSERLRAIEALAEDSSPQQQQPSFPTSLRRLIISDDEDEDVRILMERTQELLRSSKKKKKKKESGQTKELVQSSCESDQGIGSMPSSIISVSGHVNPLPEEKEEQEEDCPSLTSGGPRKKGLATKRSELLMEKPIKPNIHVGSRLKAMLEENKGSGAKKQRILKKTGKWDAIMKNINDNQKSTEKRTYKEVKSKVFDEIGGGSSSPRAKASKSGSKSGGLIGGNSGRSSSRASLASTTGRPEGLPDTPRDKAKESVRRYANGNSNSLESQKKSSPSNGLALGTSGPKLSAARKSKDRRIGTTNSSRNPANQPDLVKSSTRAVEESAKYTGLEDEVDAKSRQVQELRRRLSQSNKGFDVMTILYQQTLSKVNSNIRNKDLESQIKCLQNKLTNKDQEIDDLKKEESKLKTELESGLTKYRTDKCGVTEDYNRRLSQIKTQHTSLLEKVERNYRDDIEELKANHCRVLLETQEAAEARLQHVLEENEGRWKDRIQEELSSKEESLRKLEDDSQLKENEWANQKEEFSSQINDLVRQIEATPPSIAVTNVPPSPATPKTKSKEDSVIANLKAEVDSLKAVVDMRTADVHQLRKDNVALEIKLAEFDKMKTEHAKTLAVLEDLRAQIESKSLLERKLSEENRYLQTSVEKELVEKKRLSMENEELQWKIRHDSTSGDISSSHNQSMSYMEGVSPRSGGVLFDYDEDEAAKLSYSFTEGVSESPFKPTKSGLSRSMSLKERKMGVVMSGARRLGSSRTNTSIDIMSTSLPPPRHGKSAFVREVIDKGDSVSWKIEYEAQALLSPSPIAKRRSCPPSMNLARRKASSLLYNEPLSESSESSSSSSTSSMGEITTPASVNIGGQDSVLLVLNADELSSSSEIEVEEKRSPTTETEEESTLRPEVTMATSLPSYDLALLFASNQTSASCKESGGESLMTLEEEETMPSTPREDESKMTDKTMTDSLSAVSWSDDFEE